MNSEQSVGRTGCRPQSGGQFSLKGQILALSLLFLLGTPAFAVQSSVDLAIALEWEGGTWTWNFPGANFSGPEPWGMCGLGYRSGRHADINLSSDTSYTGTVSGDNDICDAFFQVYTPGCYDLYVDGKNRSNVYPCWRNGYLMGMGPDSTSFSFSFYITPNANSSPIAEWEVENIFGEAVSHAPVRRHYPMPADGVSQAIATVINTTYPVTFMFVGTPPGGCTLTNIANGAIFTAGTNEGTAHIVAQTDDPNPCLDKDFWFDLGICPNCTGGDSGCNSYGVGNSVDLKFGLGPSRFGVHNAFLQVLAETPSANLGSPQSLKCNFIRPDLAVFTNSTGWLRQVRSLDRVIDIVTISPSSYLLNSYHIGDILGYSNTNGFQYYFNNSPYQTVMIELVNGDTNHLRVTDNADPAPADFYWVTNGWALVTGNGLRQHTKVTINNGAVYTNIVTIADAVSNIKYQSTETWQTFSYGNRLIQKTIGSGQAAQTESYTYTTNGMLQQVNHSDGSWDIYTYDLLRRQVGHYSPFLNSAPTTNSSLCRYTASTYTNSAVAGSGDDAGLDLYTPRRVINYVQGVEVSRSYTVVKSGERDEIQCVSPGAAWNASGNLVMVTYSFIDAANLGKPSRIIRPDGTLQLFSYDTSVTAPWPNADSSYDKTTVWTGAPDTSMENVVDGTQDETWTDSLQHIALHRVTDVASGIIIDQQTFYYDDRGHLVHTAYLNGTTTDLTYDCCNLISSTTPDGTVTSYSYDALKRRVMTTVNSITTFDVLDAAGNVLGVVRYGMDGSAITNSLSAYDNAGRLVSSIDGLDHTTTYTNYFDGNGQLIKVTTYPDLSTRIETYAKDGSFLKVTGTAANPVRYDYGVESDGGVQRLFRKEIKLNANGNDTSEWTKTYTDMLGRAYKTVYASASGSPGDKSFYNNNGQLVRQVDPDGLTTLYQYNFKGEVAYTAVDMNTNGVIDFNGTDRITQTISDVITNSNNFCVRRTRTFVWQTNSSNVSNLVSTTETFLDGLQSWNIVWNNGVGVTNHSQTVYDPPNSRTTVISVAPDGSASVSISQYGQLISVTRYDTNIAHVGDTFGHQISQTIYGYDAHGRQNTVTDARDGTTTGFFNNADQVVSTLTPSPDGVQSGQLTTNILDSMGRVIQTILPDSTSVTNVYYTNGLLQKTYGSRTYPVQYTYDYAGRIKTMTTWTNFAASAGAAVTTWNYDGYRGFLTNKAYADSKGPSYTYTAAGRLQTRTWARTVAGQPLITTYSHDNAGSLTNVSYSDGTTPFVTTIYDRRGRITQQSTLNSQRNSVYNDAGELLSESYSGGPLNGLSVTNGYDSLLRRTKLALNSQLSNLNSTAYGYDPASRLSTVFDGTNTALYAYVANSPLVGNIVFQRNGQTAMTTTKTYDYLNRLTTIQSSAGVSPAASFNYNYNSANQRTAVTNTDNSHWVYQYDNLGQVISGKKYWSDGTPVAGQQFTYNFDDIGNRKTTASGGDQSGAGLRPASYSVNNLNQYTSRDVPGYVTVLGSANSNATVTVNLQRAYRHGNYFQDELGVNNSSSALWLSLTNLAVLNNGTNADIVATNMGNVFVPQTPETFGYDADGNLTNDGRFTYTWDAENRLINLTSLSSAPIASKVKLDFAYDYHGRRIQKIVSTNNGTSYVAQSTNRFVYDGWNLIAILNPQSSILQSFVWGSDLSGSLQSAGGIGGLISMTVYSGTNAGTYFCSYDGNGNVAALVNAADGTVSANYEYDPFGQVIRATGLMAKANPFRFSTKYQDDETGLNYYGYRYYNSITGRWPNHDPIGERGGLNLYEFVANNPQKYLDPFGLDLNVITGTLTYSIPCCDEKDKVTVGLIVRGKYSEQHNPGIRAQHTDVILADGSLVGFFGSRGGISGFGMTGVVADKPWFDANRPYYNNADLAEKYGLVSTYCTLRVCPSAAKKFQDAWKSLASNPPNFNFMGGNCSTRAGGCFQAAGILNGGVSGLDTPNHLFEDLKAKYGSSLKCQTGFFGYDPSGNPYVIPPPPGAPKSPNTKDTSDVIVSQGTPSSN